MRKAFLLLLAALLALSPALASAEHLSTGLDGVLAALSGAPEEAATDDGAGATADGDAASVAYYQAEAAYRAKDYETVLELIEPLVAAGDARAQLLLARMYYSGSGVERDYGATLALLTPLAEAGNADALCEISGMYARGDGVEQSDEKEVEYLKAAAAGSTEAMVKLGDIYRNGWSGVRESPKTAYKYYGQAARAGNASGMFYLAMCLEHGIGVDKTPAMAVKWYRAAADSGNLAAYGALGDGYRYGFLGDTDYEKAMEVYLEGSIAGDENCSVKIGDMYRDGIGVEQNLNEAAQWYCRAGEQGYPDSMVYDLLTDMGFRTNGTGFKQGEMAYTLGDYARALEILAPLAEEGDGDAQALLGDMYYFGDGVEESKDTAMAWFRLAADQGNPHGLFGVGFSLLHESSDESDHAQGLEYIKQAARKGDLSAQNVIGQRYFYGVGVEQSYELALNMLIQPAESGYETAAFLVGLMYFANLGQTLELSQDFFWSRAMTYFLKASEGDDASANYMIGLMCEHGLGVARDADLAARYYRLAADQGVATLEAAMGDLYPEYYAAWADSPLLGFRLDPPSNAGEGASDASVVSSNEQAVSDYFSTYMAEMIQQANAGDPKAQYLLGATYYSGLNPDGQSFEKAAHYFKLSADQNYGPGCYFLANCYDSGDGVPQDADMAKYYYDLAAQLGVSNEEDILALLN